MKKEKYIDGQFQILNINFKKSIGEPIPEDYSGFFERIFKEKVSAKARGNQRMLIRTLWTKKLDNVEVKFGQISKFVVLDTNQWLNIQSLEVVEFEIPKNVFPNLKDLDFWFFPQFHRLVIDARSTAKIKIGDIEFFLKQTLNSICGENNEVVVTVEQDINGFEQIFAAKEVHSLEINVTYSNNDQAETWKQFMDQKFRETNTSSAHLDFKAPKGQSLQVDQPLILGSLALAQSNGDAIAKVVDQDGIGRKIITRLFPKRIFEKFKESEKDGELMTLLHRRLSGLFPRQGTNGE